MTIQNSLRGIVTACALMAIALAVVGGAQAGAVGGPEYRNVRISDGASVEPQSVSQAHPKAGRHVVVTNLPCTPSCPQEVASGSSFALNRQLVLEQDVFDWEDAGIGAGIGFAVMLAGVGGALGARKHRIFAG